MKYFASTLLLVWAIGLTGCVTPTQQTVAYKTLGGIGFTVDGAMTAFTDAVVAGQVPVVTQLKVRELHGRYQPLYNASVRAARSDLTALAPEELAAIAAELTTLILKAIP